MTMPLYLPPYAVSKWPLSLETAVSSIVLKLQLQLSYFSSIAKHGLCNATKKDALLAQGLHFSSVIMPPIALGESIQASQKCFKYLMYQRFASRIDTGVTRLLKHPTTKPNDTSHRDLTLKVFHDFRAKRFKGIMYNMNV